MIGHARATAPLECCGLLIGSDERLTAAIPAHNLASEPGRRYLVDPRDHLAAIRLARARGEQVVGGYHSHPHSDAVPSETDVAEAFSGFLFVIVGLGSETAQLRGWRWADGNFSAVPFVRVP
jgi:proteasome lid subunit RPN8/RPN11